MDIVFAGTPEVAVPALEALVASDHTVRAVLTRPDAPVGRKRVLTPSPVKARALELGLPVIEADRLRGDVIGQLREIGADAVAVVAYGAIAGPAALSTARLGWFNLHFSLLPAHRGAAPIQRALIAGETTSGVSVFRIDTGMDTGDVVRTRTLPLDQADAAAALAAYAAVGAGELVAAFDDLAAGTADFTPQDALIAAGAQPSHAEKITAADAHLDLTRPGSEVIARSRGVSPAPGPWVTVDGKRTKLFGLTPVGGDAAPTQAPTASAEVGLLTSHDGAAVLGVGDGWLRVSEIQPFGKPRMSAADYLRGHGEVRIDAAAPADGAAPAEAGRATTSKEA